MDEEFTSKEFNKEGQNEFDSSREFNNFGEFGQNGKEYFSSHEYYEDRARFKSKTNVQKKKARRRLNTNLFSFVFSTVIALTVIVTTIVQTHYIDVESYVAEPDSLSFTFNINYSQLKEESDEEDNEAEHFHEEEFVFIATLAEDESGENEQSSEIFDWEPTVFFGDLKPDTVYRLTVTRSDTSEILLEQTYKTLKGDIIPDEPVIPEINVKSEEIGDDFIRIALDPEQAEYLSSCKAKVNGEEAELTQENGEVTILIEGLEEDSDYLVEITDADGVNTVFSKEYKTNESEVTATLESKSAGGTYIEMSVNFENKFEHDISFLLNGEEISVENITSEHAELRLEPLTENTEYTILIVDNKTGKELLTETISTVYESVSVELDNSELTYDSISLSFNIDDPTGHKFKLTCNDREKEISETDCEAFFDGFAEGETISVTITDLVTNQTVYTGEFTTQSAGPVTVTEKESSTDYFDLSVSFEIDNPASHEIKVLCNDEETEYSLADNVLTITLSGLNENSEYKIDIIDVYQDQTVYENVFRTTQTPSASVSISSRTVDCYKISVNLRANNPYNHTLALEIDGSERTYSNTVSLTNLALRSKHTVKVIDKNTNAVILNESFTTKSSLTVKVINPAYATCTFEKAFTDKYGTDLEVQMIPVNNYPTDGLFFWGSDNQTTLESQYTACYNGKYTVYVVKYNNDQSTEQVDTFETEITGGVDYMTFTTSKVDTNNIRFTRKTGKFPTIGTDEELYIEVYYATGGWQEYYLSEGDFTITNNSFTITMRSFENFTPLEYYIYYRPDLGDSMENMDITLAEGYID